jgi:Tfp pilus assembly protein PilX
VVLLLALIMLVAMTMAGIVLYRQIGTGMIIARNLSFKRGATASADAGVEAARTWLIAQTGIAALDQASVANGYFPGWCHTVIGAGGIPDANNDGIADDCGNLPAPSEFDPTTYNWTNSVQAVANDGLGNEIRYVIHRLCETVGSINIAGQQCVVIGSSTAGNTNEAADYNYMSLANTSQPYFRITTRVLGPTNTIVYTQTVIY